MAGNGTVRHSHFYRRVWLHAVAKAGLSRVHFHDLRHTGNTSKAQTSGS